MLCLSKFHVSNPKRIAQSISCQVGPKICEQSCTFVRWFWRVLNFSAIFFTLCVSNFHVSNPKSFAHSMSCQVNPKIFEQSCTFVWWFSMQCDIFHAVRVKLPGFKSQKDWRRVFHATLVGPKIFEQSCTFVWWFWRMLNFNAIVCRLCLSNFPSSNPEKITKNILVWEWCCNLLWWFRRASKTMFCTLCLWNFYFSNPKKIAQNHFYQVGAKIFE